ncbi:MAG: hypothetical protein H7A45_14305 [Verrucomicrobiales bacterium]|nr:hypothetical protein [Verrucomicrobiales bacterium]MCP5526352.1 hypothetical protein [Verrucomicrobiales bacterium]
MRSPLRNRLRTAVLGRLALLAVAACTAAEEPVTTEIDGRLRIPSVPAPDALRNPWPAEWERAFEQRAEATITWFHERVEKGRYGTTWFESEKASYPNAMFAFLAGDREPAIRFLESEDAMRADHAHTEGIDFYPCFTLKGQVRKYFLFGQHLDPDYRERMFRGAKPWTAQDPLHRPHPQFGQGSGEPGWLPQHRGGWVDARGTDNLRAMRDIAIYLFAEETGNESTRQIARERILHYLQTLYHAGMSEWDSENYHGHAIAAYHNLYDFAKDREVQALGKAALDWLYAAAAVKYWRGGFGAPNCRDYGGANVVYGSGAARTMDVFFGDTVIPNPEPERDQIHLITSAYRPPRAVVALARKQFERPVELFATKPPYRRWQPGEDIAPRFWETTYFGRTFQMGSVVSAEPEETWNVSPFKLMAWNSKRGVDFLAINTSPLFEQAGKHAGDQIAQHRNLLLWLTPAAADRSFRFLFPRSAEIRGEAGLGFFGFERTWVAVWPIHIDLPAPEPFDGTRAGRYAAERHVSNAMLGSDLAGFAMEVGEAPDFPDYDAFRAAIISRAHLNIAGLAEGNVELTGTDGRRLRLEYSRENDLPRVVRDGQSRDWDAERDLYAPVTDEGPIEQKWMSGQLRVTAGDWHFESAVDREGKVSFAERPR